MPYGIPVKGKTKQVMKLDNLLAFISGLFGGCIKYLLDANPNYPSTLAQATLTALISGAAGYAGKEIVVFIKRKIKG